MPFLVFRDAGGAQVTRPTCPRTAGSRSDATRPATSCSRTRGQPFATPASNQQIADEVSPSVPRVKAHLHDLIERLGVGELPHNAKRAKLVEVAFQTGAVSVREL